MPKPGWTFDTRVASPDRNSPRPPTGAAQTTFTETRIVDKARRQFVAIALNLWGDREVTWVDGSRMSEKELGRRLGVQFTPTLLFFNEKAEVVLRLNGYQPPHRMDATLDHVAAKQETKQSYVDYIQRAAQPEASATLAEQPFFLRQPYALQRGRGTKPLLVLFERTHCASCDELHREGPRRKEVAALLPRFDIARFEPKDGTPVSWRHGRANWRSTTRRSWCSSTQRLVSLFLELFRSSVWLV